MKKFDYEPPKRGHPPGVVPLVGAAAGGLLVAGSLLVSPTDLAACLLVPGAIIPADAVVALIKGL